MIADMTLSVVFLNTLKTEYIMALVLCNKTVWCLSTSYKGKIK